MNRISTIIALALCLSITLIAQTPPRKTIASVTEKLQKIDGFIPLYINADDGKIFMEITRLNSEFLHLVSLPTGVGSNAIGLDRNQPGTTKVLRFERAGNKVLLVQPNYDYRALTSNPAERRSVEESFARSVIWGFKIEASEGERVLVDATGFLIRDAHGVADALNQARQGTYGFDEGRSALYLPNTKGFPKNTEVEATITLSTNAEPGGQIRQVAPTPRYVTVRERQSFVELPDDGYKPRRSDPRVGMSTMSFFDYGTRITDDLEKRWIRRFRLEKKDPSAAISDPVVPIIYYVDNGAPKDIQAALIEGASWWNQAFEAAGFRNAFQVKVLPADADPMDIRYNVINWVHRSTRGWSIGNSIVDPRTGEIIKGDVTLDSQRARQDFLLGSGMAPLYAGGADTCNFALLPDIEYLIGDSPRDQVEAMLLARVRQLSAHEVGHTIGLMHNFAASTYHGSVMDYPAPWVDIRNGQLDFSNAYGVGVGSYDKFAITYGYAQFAPGADEDAELNKIVRSGVADGMLYLYDQDARPYNAANPLANLWDSGPDPVASLRHEMEVRRIGLEQFGIRNIGVGAPLSELENKFLPLYLHHRYQLEAAIRTLGGVYYTNSVREKDGPIPSTINQIVPAAKQRDALAAALVTIQASELVIPERILTLIPPPAFTYRGSPRSETFAKNTTPIFDPLGAAQISADLTISSLLEPSRAARMIDFNSRDKANPHFSEVVDALIRNTWGVNPTVPREPAVQRVVQSLIVSRLMDLAANEFATPQVRAVASEALRGLLAQLRRPTVRGTDTSHRHSTAEDIERFLARPDAPRKKTELLRTPPGDPIGSN